MLNKKKVKRVLVWIGFRLANISFFFISNTGMLVLRIRQSYRFIKKIFA